MAQHVHPLKPLFEGSGLTLRDLAAGTDRTPQHLSRVLNGRTPCTKRLENRLIFLLNQTRNGHMAGCEAG